MSSGPDAFAVTGADGLRVSWVDVFTDRPFAGNQLAVVHDADELSDEQMQAIAAEFRLSETVFVLEDARRLRIFTPTTELPLAGHPVVGTSVELARLGRIPAEGRTVFLTGVGETPVDMHDGVATMTQAEPQLGEELEPEPVAQPLGIDPEAIAGRPVLCSTGFEFCFVELRDRDVLAGLRPDLGAVAELEPQGLVAWAVEEPGVAAQRLIAPKLVLSEDPATGIAAGALGALRVFRGAEPGALTVRQGAEIGRPSTIRVEVEGEPGRPAVVRVSGRAALVAEAVLRALP